MLAIAGVVRNYAWGSHTALAQLRGVQSPSEQPEAELWFGAHEGDPAPVRFVTPPQSLLDAIEADRSATLGSAARRYGRLPFLLKVLAAEEPLSLQAHPNRYQAAAGFAEENRAGIPLDAPHRNYKDTSPKPELVVALEEFEALAGFRSPRTTLSILEDLAIPELKRYHALLARGSITTGLKTIFSALISLEPEPAADLTDAVVGGCLRYLSDDEPNFAAEAATVVRLAKSYPGDVGAVASLLLNRITLQPGEGLFLDAGNLHAYLGGTAVEIMASSDNVLRCGLTPKHIDVPELLHVLDFNPIDPPVVTPHPGSQPGEMLYPTPAREFNLTRFSLTDEPVEVFVGGPRIVLVTAGEAQIICSRQVLRLAPGQAAFLLADDAECQLRAVAGTADVFLASVDSAR